MNTVVNNKEFRKFSIIVMQTHLMNGSRKMRKKCWNGFNKVKVNKNTSYKMRDTCTVSAL